MTPNLNLNLSEALDTTIVGDAVYFLLPGHIVRYNIPYNVYDEIVKLTESMDSFILTVRHLALDNPKRFVLLLAAVRSQ